MKCILIAHRCGPGKYPEQSIASARQALLDGADMVEMDVHNTSDLVPVICHDPNTRRMFGVDSPVSDLSYAEFMTLRQVGDPSYPSHSLENVMQAQVKPLLLHCKITGSALLNLLSCIQKYDYADNVTIGVVAPDDVQIVKQTLPAVKVLSFMPEASDLERFVSTDADIIRLWEDWVTQERINRIHAAKKDVWIMAGKNTPEGVGYTSEENIRAWIDMGVDGILANDIPWASALL